MSSNKAIFLTFLSRILVICATLVQPVVAADLIDFWDRPQKGANSFNVNPPDRKYFDALVSMGATWVRLTFTKWDGAGREFLIGDADHYKGLVAKDLAVLRGVLNSAYDAGLKVVLVPLSLPGARWSQHNGMYDDRLWTDISYQNQAMQFWADLATALKDHPAVAAYNILNEPAPEKIAGPEENASKSLLSEWQNAQAGGLRDLTIFYDKVIGAIRKVDPVTPVMVESGWFANPRSLAVWPAPLADDRVLYAFHMYEPYEATSAPNRKRKKPLRYPGVVTEYAGGKQRWDQKAVAAHMNIAFDWAKRQKLPSMRIVVSEFGCMRLWADCGAYLTDILDTLEAQHVHWAFYAFREDEWEGMDYELPSDVKPGQFYWLTEQGKADKLPRNGELMNILRARMENK